MTRRRQTTTMVVFTTVVDFLQWFSSIFFWPDCSLSSCHQSRYNRLSRFPRSVRYNSLVADGDKKGAYGLAAQLFDGTDLAEVSRLSEESFKLNMEHLVRACSSCVKETLKLQLF